MSTAIGAVGIIPCALSGAGTSATLGAMTNVISGRDWNEGLGMAAAFGAVGGGISGFSAAKASGSGIWFGTEVKPSASIVAGNINNATKDAQMKYDKSLKSQSEPINMSNTAVADSPIEFTTSSASMKPSVNYTIYDGEGNLFKFGVSDADLIRMNQSLKMAGEGATSVVSEVLPKFQAHINETYLRSLHFNSTGTWKIPGMIYPYPRNFETGLRIRP